MSAAAMEILSVASDTEGGEISDSPGIVSAAAVVNTEGCRYDVFLSFRELFPGGISDPLYNTLRDAGVRVFGKIQSTPGCSNELALQALRESKICIPIFSRPYAACRWCLSELALMYELMKEGTHLILPVFYSVTPSDVKMQTGAVGKALLFLEGDFDPGRVQLWREALSAVGHLDGMDLVKLANGHEAHQVKLVTSEVLKLLRDPVRLDSRIRAEKELTCRHAEKELARRRVEEEDHLARIRAEQEDLITCRRAEEKELARRRAEEKELARRRAEEKKLARRRVEQEDLARRRAEEKDLARRRVEEALARIRADEGRRYDVFLSFREAPTIELFTKHLCNALKDAGVNVFRANKPTSGYPDEPVIQALRESKICIPIFSQDYATSGWCLSELALMYELMKEGTHTILPVFHDVTPSDIQRQDGFFGRLFEINESKFDLETVQLWREALSGVGSLEGIDLVKLANGHETQLIKLVTSKVIKSLPDLGPKHAEVAYRRAEIARRREEEINRRAEEASRSEEEASRHEKEASRREKEASRREKEASKRAEARRHKQDRKRAKEACRRAVEGRRYNVFLSYSNTWSTEFTDHLYNSLIDAGVDVFPINRPTPEYPYKLILQALRDSTICIPIFSESYASDEWCLIELALMYELMKDEGNHMMIVPVFYDVTPYDVRRPTEILNALEPIEWDRVPIGWDFNPRSLPTGWDFDPGSLPIGWDFDPESFSPLREALFEISSLKGIDLVKLAKRDQGQLVKLVTSKVLKLLRGRASNLVSNNLVGLDSRIETIKGKLDFDANDVRMLGIHGMGGIGKTTLANVVYNKTSYHFGGSCFLRNVRDTSSRYGFKHLRSQLIKEILVDEHQDLGLDSKHLLQHGLRNKKVLIVLDDVDDAKQIDELAGNFKWFGPGSRIIVTTRNRAILPEGVHEYEVQKLDSHDAFLLFCKNAFKQDLPPNELVSLSRQITDATGGLPLSVETIGSYLFTEKIDVWRGALDRLKREPKIQDRLMISYNILDDNQKQLFLDMACFFVGSNVTIPAHMWRSCNLFSDAGVEVLSLMSMIQIGDDKKIWVHDHFIDLAKEIVLRESVGKKGGMSRLWGPKAVKFLRSKKGLRKVQAIRLDCEMGSEPCVISHEKFDGLVNLRYLDLGNAILNEEFRGQLSNSRRLLGCLGVSHRELSNLRWLGWHGDGEFHIPPSLCGKNFVVLDLSKSTVKETWTGWSLLKEAKNLEVLDLTGCLHLKGTPDFFSFPRIQRLIFRDCIHLEMVHPSVGDLTNLISFDVRNCQGLKSLPMKLGSLEQLHELLLDESSIEEIPDLSGLKNLEIFSAKSCKLLRRLPESVRSLVKVRKLLLDNCESLVEISKTIGQLELLQELSLSHTRVMDLPDHVGKWSNLEVLNMDHCPISILPASLGNLPKIEVMNFSGCLNLEGEFPFVLEHLTTLRVLKLDHTNISSLPTTIGKLPHLHTLDLEGCMKLQSLPRLPMSLVNLKVTVTSSVVVPNLTELINLKHIELQRHNSSLIYEDPKDKATLSSDHVQTESKHEVFLSFRGPDTRRNITNILHTMLTREDIITFIDSEGLHVGEEIDTLLLYINQSKISIPILSKDYAYSKWCLKEAAEIVKCVKDGRQKVYPIFYDVDPDEVKNQTGNYAEAFKQHEDSRLFDAETIKEWRDALREIESRKWLQLKVSTTRSDEEPSYIGTELEKVVLDIMKMLEKLPQLKVDDDLVGMEDQIAEITRQIDADAKDVKMVGIWGIAGIGKTTLAKSIFNRFAAQFKHHSSLENVRGTSLESLKRQLLFDISKHKMDLACTSTGMSAVESRLKGKQVLILVDDVDTRDQLDHLVGERNWFGMGSIVIVTTRQEEVLRDSKVIWSNYEVKPMHPLNAFRLFCKHAFHEETPPNVRFRIFSWDIVKATGCHPLALETISRYLHSVNDEKIWQGATKIMSTKKEIRDKLKISYDALSCAEQQIFLDIACFFQGADKRMPVHMWNEQNFHAEIAILTLLRRGLVKIRDGNILWMHDLFIELGQGIVREDSDLILKNQTRLWSSEDAMKVLKRKIGTEKVKAIHLDCGSQSEKCSFSHENFRNLSNLELLRLGDANLDQNSNFEGCLSSLIWISWHRRNLLDMPFGVHLENLIVLDLSKSWIKDDWNGWNSIKEATNLHVLNLSGCHQLSKTPDLSSFSKLERLLLEDCQGLVEIDSSIGKLKALKFLDVRNCRMLKRLPQELSGLVALTELLLDGSSIQNLPLSSDMKKLEIISAISCGSLTEISTAVWEQQSLKVLNLSRTGVVYLPDSIQNLTNLVELNIDHCLIAELPQSLWKLRQLEVFNASGCRNLKGGIPPDFGSLKGLKVLRLDRTGVSSIPENIRELSLLHTLDLKDCMMLQSLPALPSSLTELKVTLKSNQIEPNLQDLINLKELEIVYCGELSKILVYLDKFPKIEKLAVTKRHTPEL